MKSGLKPRKRDRLRFLFSKNEPLSSLINARSVQPPVQNTPTAGEAYGDRERAKVRYLDAERLLEEAVKRHGDRCKFFDFSETTGEPEDFNDARFKDKINSTLASLKSEVNSQNAWERFEYGIQRLLAFFGPFLKNILIIAKECQSVTSSHPAHTYLLQ
jgi:hypothetical protein